MIRAHCRNKPNVDADGLTVEPVTPVGVAIQHPLRAVGV